jgi:hypothetical protein
MKMFKWLAASLAALVLFAAAPASAQIPFYFWWTTVDEQGRVYKTNTAGVGDVQCSVYRTNIHGSALLHATTALTTAKDNPTFSDSNGRLHFYSTIADPVDLTCFYAYGGSTSVGKLDRFTHKIVIPRDAARNISRFAVNAAATAYQSDSGIFLPSGAMITDVIIQNLTPNTGSQTSHLSVGFLGNHAVAVNNALVNMVGLHTGTFGSGAAEWIRPGIVQLANQTASQAFVSNRGLALKFHVGNQSGGDGVGVGNFYMETSYLIHVATGLGVSYSPTVTTGANIRAHVFIYWSKFHTSVNRSPAGQ